ncbi:CTNS [Lepeophtheirus salmonis]|uniref:CTNS n=1 Tax=Lepeophtheirus salmonis TaxID=72036 RepID=A0A7R8CV10_LEPSM|nr:CTNS [Lepeophtheirus salmonis]CAF2905662.1 CTNS [Lepeophtheirus salmonis]
MLWITSIQEEYFLQHPDGVNPVKLNDVIFSIHAVLVCLFTIYQCYIYEKGNQTISKTCRVILIGILLNNYYLRSDPTKMGLGLFSIFFDLIFIVQHYVLYRNKWSLDDRERIIDNDEEDPHDD